MGLKFSGLTCLEGRDQCPAARWQWVKRRFILTPTWFNIFISGLDGDRVHLQQICRGRWLRAMVMTVRLCQASSLGEKHCCSSRPPGPTRSKATRVSATGTRKQHVHTYTHVQPHASARADALSPAWGGFGKEAGRTTGSLPAPPEEAATKSREENISP